MRKTRRDRDREARRISEAIERLVGRSETSQLTVNDLVEECELRRDVVYEHPTLLESFRIQSRARANGPTVARELMQRQRELEDDCADLHTQLTAERTTNLRLRNLLAEMVVELKLSAHYAQPPHRHLSAAQ